MFLGDFWQSLRRRFGRRTAGPQPTAGAGAGTAPAAPEKPATGYLEPPAFGAFCAPLGARADHLFVLSLADIAAAGGEKWSQIRDLVALAAKGIVDSRIDPLKHRFTFLDADTLCLVMPGDPPAAGLARARAIAEALTGQLVGKQGIGGLHPVVTVTHSPLKPGTAKPAAGQEETGQAPAWLEEQLAGRRRSQTAMQVMHLGRRDRSDDPAGPPDWLQDQTLRRRFDGLMRIMHLGRRDRLDGGAGPPDWLKEQTAGRGRFGGLMRVLHLGSREDPARQSGWQDDQPSRRRLRRLLHLLTLGQAFGKDDAPTADPTAPVRPAGPAVKKALAADPRIPAEALPAGPQHDFSIADLIGDNGMALVWTPALVSNRNVIGVFMARVARAGDGTCLDGPAAYAGLPPGESLELDRFAAGQTAHELRTLYLGRQRTTLAVPVHWTSLAPRWQDAIPGLFDQCPPKAREGFLKIEVFGLQGGMPENVLKKLFDPLKRLGCDVLVRLPLTAVNLIPMLRHVQAVGVDLEELDDGQRTASEQLFGQLRKFSLTARKAKIACYVWGVAEPSWVEPLQAVGYSLISGAAVGGPALRPESAL